MKYTGTKEKLEALGYTDIFCRGIYYKDYVKGLLSYTTFVNLSGDKSITFSIEPFNNDWKEILSAEKEVATAKVKEALETIRKWAERNNINYVSIAYCADISNMIDLTYTKYGDQQLNSDGTIKDDYYKYIRL